MSDSRASKGQGIRTGPEKARLCWYNKHGQIKGFGTNLADSGAAMFDGSHNPGRAMSIADTHSGSARKIAK
jgi:hypothetical protein